MKLCRYDDDRLGVVIGDSVHDATEAQTQIRAAHPYASYSDAVIAALPEWRSKIETMAKTAAGKPLSSVRLLSPVARPGKVLAAPTNYAAHIEEMAGRRNELGVTISPKIGTAGIFLKSNTSVVGPSEGISLRFPDRSNEHEAEIVVIIGKKGTDIPKEKAFDYIAGYCLGLDMTARGPEDRSFRKSIDGYSVLGPWFVTADEIKDPSNLPFELTVNGSPPKQKSTTASLIYDIPRLIEFASSFYTLYPGDVYYTGTPEGVGPVKPGDRIRMTSVPELGALEIDVRAHETGKV
ncbi:MAG: fumarylacetoacetate hydrolase family protein [Hyphomicrobiaceae bacterium]